MDWAICLHEDGTAHSELRSSDYGDYQQEDGEVAIFSDKPLSIPVCFFNGPWLPLGYVDKYVGYHNSLDFPIQILKMENRRRNLVDRIAELQPRQNQLSLFSQDPRPRIEKLFDGLLQLKADNRPLYKRFRKMVGKKERALAVPNSPLEKLMTEFVLPIIKSTPAHPCCHGGEKGWSPRKSIETHLPMGTVMTFDMEAAFTSMQLQYVFDFYVRHLGKIDKYTEDIPDEIIDLAGFLTDISVVAYGPGGIPALPQGANFSMALFNRILSPVDELMKQCAKKRGLRYSRWVDDFVISSRKSTVRPEKLLGALSIMRDDFPIAVKKLFLQQRTDKFYLLGHKVEDGEMMKVDKDKITANIGEPVDSYEYACNREREWIMDYGTEEDMERYDIDPELEPWMPHNMTDLSGPDDDTPF